MDTCLLCAGELRDDGEQSFRRVTRWGYCTSCEFGQVTPMPSVESINEYYASGDYRRETAHTANPGGDENDGPQERNLHEETIRAEWWLPHIRFPVVAHLDVGSSSGRVLELVGADRQVGIEPGPWGKLYTSYGRIGDVGGTFDLITVFHTLEHVPNPIAILAGVERLAVGQVCVEVPAPRSRLWPHLVEWSVKSLSLAMEQTGMPITWVSQAGTLKGWWRRGK